MMDFNVNVDYTTTQLDKLQNQMCSAIKLNEKSNEESNEENQFKQEMIFMLETQLNTMRLHCIQLKHENKQLKHCNLTLTQNIEILENKNKDKLVELNLFCNQIVSAMNKFCYLFLLFYRHDLL